MFHHNKKEEFSTENIEQNLENNINTENTPQNKIEENTTIESTPHQLGPNKDYHFYSEQAKRFLNEEEETTDGGGQPFYEEAVKEEKRKDSSGSGFKRFIAACLIVSIAGGGSMGAGLALTQHYLGRNNGNGVGSAQNGETPFFNSNVPIKNTMGQSPAEIIASVSPAVVSISTTEQGQTTYFGSFSVPYEAKGAGSGVIFFANDEKIGIATNAHVVASSTQINVTFNEKETVPAKIEGTDASADLAVISVSREDLKKVGILDVPVAIFGDSDNAVIGEPVYAIGNALGEGKTATDGIVSATGKKITIEGKELEVLQTNAAINPGNSGGALINSAGQVIGINTAKKFNTVAEGMGYAIPSNVITPIIQRLLTEGTAPKPYIGIKGSNIDDATASLYKLPVGVLVREVIPGGSAAQAGIQPGDVITEFDGKKIMSMEGLIDILSKEKVGNKVSVHIIRDGEKSLDMTLEVIDGGQ